MNDKTSTPHILSTEDYSSIETALRETPTGAFFLDAYAKRNPSIDHKTLLGAIEKLQKAMGDMERRLAHGAEAQPPKKGNQETIRQEAIENLTKIEQSLLGARATERFVLQSEKATSEIISESETLSSIANHLQEQGFPAQLCKDLQSISDNLLSSCSHHELAGQKFSQLTDLANKAQGQLLEIIEQARPANRQQTPSSSRTNLAAKKATKTKTEHASPDENISTAKSVELASRYMSEKIGKLKEKQQVKPAVKGETKPKILSPKPRLVVSPKQDETIVKPIDPSSNEAAQTQKSAPPAKPQQASTSNDYIKVEEYGDLSAIKESVASVVQAQSAAPKKTNTSTDNVRVSRPDEQTPFKEAGAPPKEQLKEKVPPAPAPSMAIVTDQEQMERQKNREKNDTIIANSVSLTEALRRMRQIEDPISEGQDTAVVPAEPEEETDTSTPQDNTTSQVPEDLMDHSASMEPALKG